MISIATTVALLAAASAVVAVPSTTGTLRGRSAPSVPRVQPGSALEKRLNELASRTDSAKRASTTCVVSSYSEATGLSDCTYVELQSFTVPSGETVTVEAASGATIVLTGDITFDKTTASGPLFTIDTDNVVFNGGDYSIDGNGADYWDGEGTDGGVTKPHPFIKFKGYGTFEYVTALNTPAQSFSVGTTDTSIIQYVTVDDSAAGSLGANTDGFDISADDVTLSHVSVNNQDDCVAINKGTTILIENSSCVGSHGISIGSVSGSDVVSGVTVAFNTISGGQNGLRIKVDSDASGAVVENVVYTGNTVSGITDYGVLITQSYPDSFSTPGTDSTISGISFSLGTTTVSVESGAYGLAIDCGNCEGTWDLDDLDVTSSGKGHELTLGGSVVLSGGTY